MTMDRSDNEENTSVDEHLESSCHLPDQNCSSSSSLANTQVPSAIVQSFDNPPCCDTDTLCDNGNEVQGFSLPNPNCTRPSSLFEPYREPSSAEASDSVRSELSEPSSAEASTSSRTGLLPGVIVEGPKRLLAANHNRNQAISRKCSTPQQTSTSILQTSSDPPSVSLHSGSLHRRCTDASSKLSNSPIITANTSLGIDRESSVQLWNVVEFIGTPPPQRSLHAAVVLYHSMYIFGGYDGFDRVSDLHCYNFLTKQWSEIGPHNAIDRPLARDRHTAVVYRNAIYVFGGYDGNVRINDLWKYDVSEMKWHNITTYCGSPPTPRHSHASVVYKDCMYVFAGFDGSYLSDFFEYSFRRDSWQPVVGSGTSPSRRYRTTTVVWKSSLFVFGGHDGSKHLNDFYEFDFDSDIWKRVVPRTGVLPSARDSHLAVVHGHSMYLFGGSSGFSRNDLYEFDFEQGIWIIRSPKIIRVANGHEAASNQRRSLTTVEDGNTYLSPLNASGANSTTVTENSTSEGLHSISNELKLNRLNDDSTYAYNKNFPCPRFCHSGGVYKNSLYVFGGYDGQNRLNDFLEIRLVPEYHMDIPESSIIPDLKHYVNNMLFADVIFSVEDHIVYAHKIILARCPYFRAMFLSQMREATQISAIVISNVSYRAFVCLLEFLYTDELDVELNIGTEIFVAADQFGIERLKRLCEGKFLEAIDIQNVSTILQTADCHNAHNLRRRCLEYILWNFDSVSKTQSFYQMGRANVELLLEILARR